MSKVKIRQWNAALLESKAASVLAQTAPVYLRTTERLIGTPIWQWNWDTLREESLLMGGVSDPPLPGVTVYAGKRDIVDTGALLDSVSKPMVVRQGGKATLYISWRVPYSAKVLGGGVYGTYVNVRGETVKVGKRPPRNWIKAAYQVHPPEKIFAEIWRTAGKNPQP
jgi:hypothetical protein